AEDTIGYCCPIPEKPAVYKGFHNRRIESLSFEGRPTTFVENVLQSDSIGFCWIHQHKISKIAFPNESPFSYSVETCRCMTHLLHYLFSGYNSIIGQLEHSLQ